MCAFNKWSGMLPQFFLITLLGKALNMVIRKLVKLIALFTLILSAQTVQAGVIIDDFTDFQAVSNGENGPISVVGTDLPNLLRTLTATASPGNGEAEVVVANGVLNISNDFGSIGTTSIFYSFNTIDLAAIADGFLFNINFIDLSHEVQMVANATSFFDFVNFGGVGHYEIGFSQFTDPSVFNRLTSLQLNFRGVKNWDARFGSLVTETKSVPEPSVIALLAVGLTALSKVGNRKKA
ncbi:hypothetical protein A1359_12590 [Methylomonas lenta]|uniref:PEP-CTERM protein-sorting domain-containing protein n=2 Tax=Methylomonas lenta TaxID=980561 RepID=A0A177N5W0_9GAMM|nr:hypothetical protein A1359_12590 [Methylomonas lenta]